MYKFMKPEKDTANVDVLTELRLAFQRTMCKWNEEKYIFLGPNILQIIQKKIKDDLI